MTTRRKRDERIVTQAQRIVDRWYVRESEPISTPGDAAQFLILKLAVLDHECFGVLFLDGRHRVIAFEPMFRGSIKCTVAYPREIARAALRHNAAAVILAHNHPSGDPTPSLADYGITNSIRDALSLLEIEVLDHLVIGGAEWRSVDEHFRLPPKRQRKRQAAKAA